MYQAPRFVHLRVRSDYSLLEGAMRLSSLAGLCKDNEMPAVALTDNKNLFGALEFASNLSKSGIQPIHGCQFSIITDIEKSNLEPGSILLLAQSLAGYQNLLKLNSRLYLDSDNSNLHLTFEDLQSNSEGLICLTGGAEGLIGRTAAKGLETEADQILCKLVNIFQNRTYIELQRHRSDESNIYLQEMNAEPKLLELAYKHGIPLVATNDVHFPNREMFAAHDALICILQSTYVDLVTGRRRLTPEHYFKSQEEMCDLFSDLPEAVSNSVEIARRCAYWAETRPPILPKFTENESKELRRQAREGLKSRLEVIKLSAPEEDYQERLEYELKVIEDMGFEGYFLIVADFIKWAKSQEIPVGAGRGSGAGSLVAYALTITDIDPLRFDLIFERFLNPERISMPDFDVDFCQSRRDEVISYVQRKYGSKQVAQIITFGTLLSKGAVRDVGRVLRIPYPKVDTIAKLIPQQGVQSLPISEALNSEVKLRNMQDDDPKVRRMFDYASQLEGLMRNASTHAAGIVIGDRPLDKLVPIYKDAKSSIPVTQFSMKWVEQAGLVKFDFLGLKTLTVIKKAVDLIAKRDVHININNLPLDDKKTFEMCAAAETVAVFQLESSGMKDTLRRLKPTCIEDIVALVALYRPGPMDNIPTYCDVKNKIKKRTKEHKLIEKIVAETHGIIVYQEQVMQIAQAMAGYSLGQADLLRRSIGKKIKEDMEAEKPKFLVGAKDKGVNSNTATKVWNLMAKFAEYGFPKAHAAAYALVTYQTAYLKANFPVEFMTSVMNCDIGDIDKMKIYTIELKRLGIELKPPCVNHSDVEFSNDGNVIYYGLRAVRGVGSESVRLLVEERKKEPFKNLFDFASRVNLKIIGRRVLENLAMSGAFDDLLSNRNQVFQSIELITKHSQSVFHERDSGQISLFGEDESDFALPTLPEYEDWGVLERSDKERVAIGFYLSGHPLENILPQIQKEGVRTYEEVIEQITNKPRKFWLAGQISRIKHRTSRKGSKFAFVELSDPSASFEITVFSEELRRAGSELVAGNCVKAEVSANLENEQVRMRVERMKFIDLAKEIDQKKLLKGLKIYFRGEATASKIRALLISTCQIDREGGGVVFAPVISDLNYDVNITIPDKFAMQPGIKNAIKNIEGVVKVEELEED